MLEVHGVRKRFDGADGSRGGKNKKDAGLEVLRGIDLSVGKGDVVAIIGPSGSGKTTLLRCINFLERADEGTMVFGGETFDMARIGILYFSMSVPMKYVFVATCVLIFPFVA